MFVFAARPFLDALYAAPESFALIQMSFAVGNVLMVATQQWMTRHFGYHRYLLIALLLFAVGAVGCALSVSLPELIVAWMLLGMGGGAFFLSTRVLIPLMFPVETRPIASRFYLLTIFAMGAIAPLLSAALVVGPGWEWVFWIQLPIAAILVAGVFILMPPQFGKSADPVHWSFASILLLLLAFGSIQWALSEASYMMHDHPGRLAIAIVIGMSLLGFFSLHQ